MLSCASGFSCPKRGEEGASPKSVIPAVNGYARLTRLTRPFTHLRYRGAAAEEALAESLAARDRRVALAAPWERWSRKPSARLSVQGALRNVRFPSAEPLTRRASDPASAQPHQIHLYPGCRRRRTAH
ncbi:hypothetical protein BN2476_210145 [Paraburkholderia piptadeniae]|uniref:Uncharacterized protein n=1 Tax=Paraburkholderia piptadeniae TaxID=1701573 RepID=A0A1N7RW41_9BURK|nr:hypothetical protein BN2476_210145 [Paraburkholderia piptadeniae]